MNLYLVSRNDEYDYDQYSDFVVCAESEEEARFTHPSGNKFWKENNWFYQDNPTMEESFGSWTSPNNVSVELIGKAVKNLNRKIICTSFHAG